MSFLYPFGAREAAVLTQSAEGPGAGANVANPGASAGAGAGADRAAVLTSITAKQSAKETPPRLSSMMIGSFFLITRY
jgi:hypothetical protein